MAEMVKVLCMNFLHNPLHGPFSTLPKAFPKLIHNYMISKPNCFLSYQLSLCL